jgi:hypothetical protein
MTPFRIAGPVFASLLLAGPLLAEDRTPATADELYENPQRFHAKLVRVEGVIKVTPAAREFLLSSREVFGVILLG